MRRAATLVVLGLLLLAAPAPSAATALDPATVSVPAGHDWVVLELAILPEDWTWDGATWRLGVSGRIEGMPDDSWASLELLWVYQGNWTGGYRPFVATGPLAVSTIVLTPAPHFERVLLVASAETATQWTASLRHDGPGPVREPVLLASGVGSFTLNYDSRHDPLPEGVTVTRALHETPLGVAGLAADSTLEFKMDVSGPALRSTEARLRSDGAGHYTASGNLDADRFGHAEDVVGPSSIAFGVHGFIREGSDLRVAFAGATVTDVSYLLTVAHVPFDAAAHGIEVDRMWSRSGAGSAASVPCLQLGGDTHCVMKTLL